MKKAKTNLVKSAIALLNPLLVRMDISSQRKLQDALGALGAKALARNVRYEEVPGLHAAWAYSKSPMPGKAILYMHGGGYIAGSLEYAKRFGGVLSKNTGWSTLCLGYRLAPENPWPAALNDAVDAYREMLKHYEAENIAFIGESAGGGLCWCLALKCRELQMPLPACIVAISPWTDLSMSGKAGEKDQVLRRDNLLGTARMYAGEDLQNPLVSPLFADLTGMPASLIFAGNMEILQDDAVRMADRLIEAGCQCELNVEEGMWHVYVLYGIPEAEKAIVRIKEFLAEETTHAQES